MSADQGATYAAFIADQLKAEHARPLVTSFTRCPHCQRLLITGQTCPDKEDHRG